MYAEIGRDTIIDTDGIIGVFDLDITSQSHITRKYLSTAEKSGIVRNAADDIPKTYVVYAEKEYDRPENRRVYLCQSSPAALLKRTERGIANG